MASLEIYKASAGSGKTFRIVREYLKMVFQRPAAYKNILAVTFTNKATAEMKDRILKDLSALATGKSSGHLEFLMVEFRQSEEQIRLSAEQILKLILHDYSRFSISTIDSFFQRVIRAFSREMRLNGSFRTELDSQTVLEEAVDRLFLEIDSNEGLRSWMLEFADENLKEGKSWNFREDLTGRGKELFKEEFKLFSEPLLAKLADKSYLTRYNQQLRKLFDDYEQKMIAIGNQGLRLIASQGLSFDQFKFGKSSFANHFNKLATGNLQLPGSRTLDACNNLEVWYKGTDSPELKQRIESVYEAGLNQLLADSISLIHTEGVLANTAKVIMANLFSFGLLTDIALKVQEVSKEKNLVLLNDSTQLLRKVISGSDSPFVYEKMGSVYRNFMLDEFQDTSRLQWHNFKPLIDNSLSEGNRNIIVGDVKQSIYRWRNGDWNLLATQIEKDLSSYDTSVVPLDTNWRSSKKVIDFNNILFRECSKNLNADFETALSNSGHADDSFPQMRGVILQAYTDHYQKLSGKIQTEGYVKLQFIESQQHTKKSSYHEAAIQSMIMQLEQVQENGVRPADIAILVREKREGALVAQALLDRKISNPDSPFCYDVISNDSLIIGQSPVVRFILNFLTLFSQGTNDILKADLIYGYYTYLLPLINGQKEALVTTNPHSLLTINLEVPDLFKPWFREPGNNAFDPSLLSLPLFELASLIAKHFQLTNIKGELVYLEGFLDLVLQYGRDDSGGIAGFLDWWETAGNSKSITLSEGQNAISILTIHKSKGLEFHTVIIPFCDWDLIPKSTKAPYLWCHPTQPPFDLMDLVLVQYGSVLQQTLFAEAYFHEMLYSFVDNLNLLYVAFTRAINTLIVFCPYSPNPLKNISYLIQNLMENTPLLDSIDRERYIDLGGFWDPDLKKLEIGELKKVRYSSSNIGTDNQELNQLILAGKHSRLKLRIHSDVFFELNDSRKTERIGHGKLMHELFEKISTLSDVPDSINRVLSEGKIDSKTAEEYKAIIFQVLGKAPFNSWFSGDWKVFNERDILRGKESRHRPDRVMIKGDELIVLDYKTGEKSDAHHAQVHGYLKDFIKMGFPEAKGFLWYLSENELVEIL
jgi:ATP-dependent helicase/nuclease subunit A